MSTRNTFKFFSLALAIGAMSHSALGAANQCSEMKETLQGLARKQEALPINFTDSEGKKYNSYGELQARYDELSAKYVILKGLADLKFKFDAFKQKALDKDFGAVDNQLLLDIKNISVAKDTAKKLAILRKELEDNFAYQTMIGDEGFKTFGTQIAPVEEHYQTCLQSHSIQSQARAVCVAAEKDNKKGISKSIAQLFNGGGYSEMINGFNQAKQVLTSNQSAINQKEIREDIIKSYRNISGDLNDSDYYHQMSDVMNDAETSMMKDIYEIMEQRKVNISDADFQKFRDEFAKDDLEKFQEEYSQCFVNSMFNKTGSPLSDCEEKKQAINNSAQKTLKSFQNFLLSKELLASTSLEEITKKELNILNEKQNIMAKVKSLEDFMTVVDTNKGIYNFHSSSLLTAHCSTPKDIQSCLQELNANDLKEQMDKASKAFTEIQVARGDIIKLFDNPEYHKIETMKQYMIAEVRNGKCGEDSKYKFTLVESSECARNLDSSTSLTSFVKVGEDFIRAIDKRYPAVYEEEMQSLEALGTISDYCSKEYNIDADDEEDESERTVASSERSADDIRISRHCNNYVRRYNNAKKERGERIAHQKKVEDLNKYHYVYDETSNILHKAPKRSVAATMFVSGMKSSMQLLPTYFQTRTNKSLVNMQANALIARKQYLHSMQGAYQWYGYGVSSYGLNYPVNSNFYYNNPIYFQSQNSMLQSISGTSSTATPNSFSW